MSRVLVFGHHGQVASELFARAGENPAYRFLSRDQIPASSAVELASVLDSFKPDTVVNCAAYTAVDKAETEVAEAGRLNRDFVISLAKLTAERGSHLVHFSTDYVFDGAASKPYVETDVTHPLSVYGSSKLAGEQGVFEFGGHATILRTQWVYSRFGNNFVKTIVRLANGEKPLRVVDDQFGTPTAAGDLADFVIDQLVGRASSGVELYHFSGEGQTTWNGFAREIAKLWKTGQREIVKIPATEFPTPARRPAYGVLSKAKLKMDFGYVPLDWRDALQKRYWGND